jgi:hypothetical protein
MGGLSAYIQFEENEDQHQILTFFKPAFSLFPSESSLEKAFLNPFPNISSWVCIFEFRALFFRGAVVKADVE